MASTDSEVLRVFIVAAVRIYREGLAVALARSPIVEVVGSSATPELLFAASSTTEPAVVLLDVPAESRHQAVSLVLKAYPNTKVVAFGINEVISEVVALAAAGAVSYVASHSSLEDLILAVEGAPCGQLNCPPHVAGALLRQLGKPSPLPTADRKNERITDREIQIMELVCSGLSNQQISRTLNIALSTVKNHLHGIFHKYQVHSRSEALARYRGG
jgi:two-component system, NarL family, nitrate/nitrite response regulator NarL